MALVDEEGVAEAAAPVILDRAITDASAWQARDLDFGEWHVAVTPDALAELNTLAETFADYDGPVEDLAPDAFDWPATTEVMVEVQQRLNNGVGFAVLDRLPCERWTETASRAIVWLLTCFIAPPIMQKWKGARVYDVRDTGASLSYGVRRSVTNLSQEFHTDGSFLGLTPDYIGLACLQQAEAGGMSRVASLTTVHNRLRETAPEHLERLYRPFWWDRQAEHGEDDRKASWLPIFETDGERLSARYYDDYIRNGYRLMGAALDDGAAAALGGMKSIAENPANWIEFQLQPGQIEYAHNRLIAHGRTAFRDPKAEQTSGRHLLRFWLRSAGGIELEADPALVL